MKSARADDGASGPAWKRGNAADDLLGRMTVGVLLRISAMLEGTVALVFLFDPSLPVWALFGQPLDAAPTQLAARIAGAALLSLAMACWWAGADSASRAASSLVAALLVYDLLAIFLLLHARMVLTLSGIGLWPAVVLHAALALWCMAALRQRYRRVTNGKPSHVTMGKN
jgi:hypothetical protein